ncbi:MAG: Apolipoprotein N-acyltransferase-like protein [Pedosphaera sp.]|nr:Apolipoprotein N-acyltransferase-like protein [Pedosphaera sp.]
MNPDTSDTSPGLGNKQALLLSLGAVAAFQLAYTFATLSFLIVVYLGCLFELSRLKSGRLAFYTGLAIGLLACAPQLSFFWNIFGAAALALWVVLAFWLGLFLALASLCRVRLGRLPTALLIPFLWTGLEYFRSELYYLRFSWLNAGYVFSDNLPWLPLKHAGVYGVGFVIMVVIAFLSLIPLKKRIWVGSGLLGLLALLTNTPRIDSPSIVNNPGRLTVAGIQLEFPSEPEVLLRLNQLVKAHPQAQLLVLSEYTISGPVPESIKAWCRKHQRHLIIGAKDAVSESQYYNTAFVIGPTGDILFRQAKGVPIQFFKDGLPAREQKLWASPWGKIGICICYDLSYSRVTDELVRLGAQALVVPTMDIVDWGRHQHELHARVAPIRAAEYGIPIFRLASSGISQCVCATGQTTATAPFPGEAAMLTGVLDVSHAGRLQWDRVIAPLSVCVTGLTIGWLVVLALRPRPHLTQPD